ncbi:hypothetical protein RB620_05505 [Paenibacillus sp. LHD-117]|uniref:hypothetical protein n=1 Tax=Paenibacillus sp. LHD-117 TaxID=3071412 RepID=UPI0027E1D259|nr:hypothetical protein [Paenibacillus sp. LHD-117]MDQ6418893.1 hypothetical protein [Paenibacillus sp. LHD-117]
MIILFRQFRISVLSMLIIIMAFSSLNMVAAEGKSDNDPFTSVENFLAEIDKNNYSESLNYFVKPMKEEFSLFIQNKENEGTGILGVKKAKLKGYKELDHTAAQNYTPYFDAITAQYNNVHFFYVAVDYKVTAESEMNMNGINYIFVAVVMEDGEWRIAQYSVAPVDNIVGDNQGFNTSDEQNWVKQYRERFKGDYLNRSNKILKTNAKLDVENEENTAATMEMSGLAVQAADEFERPATIKVKLMKNANWTHYKCIGVGCIVDVDFYYYIKNTLVNEWTYISPMEALKSGAMAVKMYAWFAVYNPLSPLGNYALNDGIAPSGTYPDQAFDVKTEKSRTTDAINAVGNLAMGDLRNNVVRLFLARYALGQYNGTFDAHTGELQQEGSRWWAEPLTTTDPNTGAIIYRNKDMYWILDYYYLGSTEVADLVFFTY